MAVRNNGGCRRVQLPAGLPSRSCLPRHHPVSLPCAAGPIPQLRPRSRKQPGQSCIPSAVRFPSQTQLLTEIRTLLERLAQQPPK